MCNGLCRMIVQIAQNDAEAYTRASALTCLSQMVVVDIYWETCLSSINIIVSLDSLLREMVHCVC